MASNKVLETIQLFVKKMLSFYRWIINYMHCLPTPKNYSDSHREMDRRRLSCRWCGMPFVVPLEAQTLRCPACQRVTILQNHGRPDHWNMVRVQVQPQYAPTAHGRKRALLCGITYKGHNKSLNGSINDVLYMKRLLVERFGFPSPSILVLTEEEDFSCIPTKKNIRAAMRWLVQGCQPGDSLVFHYSGHGSQVRDRDGDELDGFDESLLPVDYEIEGRILDDEINATIVRPLPRGATLHSIVDTCFSGTFLDLSNICRINRDGYYKWEDHRISRAYKGTSGGYAISISACDDHQNSGDTTAFTGAPIGALTYSFVQTLKEQPRLTYGQLLIIMHKKIDAAREEVGLNSNEPHKSQEPLLSSSYKFDIHSKAFTL